MPEYIERAAAIKMIEEDLPEVIYYRKEDAITCLECLPAADVVLKSVVSKETFDRIESTLNEWIKLYYTIAVNTFDSIEQAKATASESVLRAFRDYVTEARKKFEEAGI